MNWIDHVHVGDARELAYAAGVIDSDGTIGIKRVTYHMRVLRNSGAPTYSERICVKQVEPQAVQLLKELFGGSLYMTKAYATRGKPLYTWHVTDVKAATALQALLPYIRIKRQQAENCLLLRTLKCASRIERVAPGRGHVGAAPRSAEMNESMEARYLRAKELNRVGI